jgi:hypothetical protein
VRAVAQRPVESLQQQNERLKRALAEKTLEVDFFYGALQQVEARRRQNTASAVIPAPGATSCGRLDGRSQPDPARSYVIIYVIGD